MADDQVCRAVLLQVGCKVGGAKRFQVAITSNSALYLCHEVVGVVEVVRQRCLWIGATNATARCVVLLQHHLPQVVGGVSRRQM